MSESSVKRPSKGPLWLGSDAKKERELSRSQVGVGKMSDCVEPEEAVGVGKPSGFRDKARLGPDLLWKNLGEIRLGPLPGGTVWIR